MPAVAVPPPIETVTGVFAATAASAVAVTVTDVEPASSTTLDGLTDSVTEVAAPLASSATAAVASITSHAAASAGVQTQTRTAGSNAAVAKVPRVRAARRSGRAAPMTGAAPGTAANRATSRATNRRAGRATNRAAGQSAFGFADGIVRLLCWLAAHAPAGGAVAAVEPYFCK